MTSSQSDASEARSLIDVIEAAPRVGVKPKTLRRWAWEGRIPYYRLSGKAIRFDPRDLEKFLAARRVD
jgi:excisionase family DNA binding protein